MSEYKYERPEGKHYRVSIRKWNKEFGCRGRWPFVESNIYVNKDYAVVHHNISFIGKLLAIALSPIIYFAGTVCYGFPETHSDFKKLLFDKKYGSFSSDEIFKRKDGQWGKLEKIIGEKL